MKFRTILPSTRRKLRLGQGRKDSGSAGGNRHLITEPFSLLPLSLPPNLLPPKPPLQGSLSFSFYFQILSLYPLSFSSAKTLLLPSSSPSFLFWMLLMSVVSPPSGSLVPTLSQPLFSHLPRFLVSWRVIMQTWGDGAEHQDHGPRSLEGWGGAVITYPSLP